MGGTGDRRWSGLVALGAIALSLLRCQAIQPVAFEPFADGQDSVLIEPMTYSIENTGVPIVVPAGFVTDFASTPRAIWAVLPPFGTYQKASVIHDYLYWMQECTKDQADKILFIAMKESNVNNRDRWVIYYGVHDFGQSAWDQNAKERQEGLTRFVPPDSSGRVQLGANDIWNDRFRAKLSQAKQDQKSPQTPVYCKIADQLFADP